LDRVLDRLQEEFVGHGRLDYFNRLKAYMAGQAEVPYAELAGHQETSLPP